MKGKSWASKEVCITKDCVEEAAKNQLCKDVAIGDVIWVKLNGSSWWPAQVVDENSVSGKCKPSKRAEGEVLVRLYGSYKYLYTDWIKCRSEFVIKLMENNGNYHEIIMETLKQDLLHIKSGRSKRQESKTKAVVSPKISTKTTEAKSRKRKQGEGQNIEPNSPKSLRTSPRQPVVATKTQALKPEPSPSRSKTRVQNGSSRLEKTEKASRSKAKNHDALKNNPRPSNPSTRFSPLELQLSPRAQQTPNRDGKQKNIKYKPQSAPTSTEKPQEPSARKMKVMQSLALIAPSESPFQPKHIHFSKPV